MLPNADRFNAFLIEYTHAYYLDDLQILQHILLQKY